jgi:carbon-monoxide dehydrogenase large subunit
MVNRKPHIVGRSFPRVEAKLKVSGRSQYVDDIDFGPHTLHACLVPSTEPHARLLSIDANAARKMPGVAKVLTGQDFNAPLGLFLKDRTLLADGYVRYVGQPVAVVVAESRALAYRAARSVVIEYETMPAAVDVLANLGPDAPLVHPNMASYEGLEYVSPTPGTNVCDHVQLQWGDLESGWEEAGTIIEHTYKVGRLYHASLEPHGAVARMDHTGKITLWASNQRPYTQRTVITQALGLEPDQLRVVTPCVGGGFGGKVFPCVEAIVVAVAREFQGRPVKLVLDRKGEFASTFMRPGLTARVKMGVSKDGVITALKAAYYWNVGVSADAVIKVVRGAVLAGTGPYRVSNCEVDSYGIYSHEPPASPMRGNGMAELHWAVEQHIDRMADAIGMDRLAFRLRNLLKGGDRPYGGRVMHATGLESCVRGAAETIGWSEETRQLSDSRQKVRGKGLAAMWNPVVILRQPGANAVVTLDADHICTVSVGGVESGQGIYTLAVQLVASELGVPQSWVRFSQVDTEHGAIEWTAACGHLTWTMGNAVVQAAQDVKNQVLSFVAQAWDEPVGNLDIIDGDIVSYGRNSEHILPLTDLLSSGIDTTTDGRSQVSFEGKGRFEPTGRLAPNADDVDTSIPPIIHFSTGAQAVEVEVDVETGAVQVLHVVPAFDVGHALNPDIVRAQMKGGSVQGLGMALLEQIQFDDGVPQNRTFLDYRIASIKDTPNRIDPIIVEVPQDDGPYGARGIGEHALISAAPAIASAISDALGTYFDELPLTAEKIWQALETINAKEGMT